MVTPKVCGNEYEAKLAECRAGLPTNAAPAVLLQRQWECSASADTTRYVQRTAEMQYRIDA